MVGEVAAGHVVDGPELALLAHVARVGPVGLLVQVADLLLLHGRQCTAVLDLCQGHGDGVLADDEVPRPEVGLVPAKEAWIHRKREQTTLVNEQASCKHKDRDKLSPA